MKNTLKSTAMAAAIGLLMATTALAETRIGVSMTSFNNPFLTILLNGMKQQAGGMNGVALQVEDANLDVSAQLNQVQNFIASGVNAIIVNAVDGDSTLAITKMAKAAGSPLVYANHPPVDIDTLPENTAFVGSNELDSGTLQTIEVCKLLGGKGKALVMIGPLENHAALTRTKDVKAVLARDECKGIEIVGEQTANWSRSQAQDLMANWITTGIEFNAVIANNDEMAIGAIQAMKAAGVSMKDVVIAGIDATPDGLQAMQAGDLDVTVFQNATKQGAESVQAAVDMADGQQRDQHIWVPFELVTPANMGEYLKK